MTERPIHDTAPLAKLTGVSEADPKTLHAIDTRVQLAVGAAISTKRSRHIVDFTAASDVVSFSPPEADLTFW